jgi:uncharacterized protein (TIGR00369 family)
MSKIQEENIAKTEKAARFLSVLPHCKLLGMSIERVGDHILVMRLPYSVNIVGNPLTGTVHGGSLTTLMDTACGTCVFISLPGHELCPTLDLRVDYMKAATPGLDLFAVAKVTRISSSVVFTRCDVIQGKTYAEAVSNAESEGSGDLVATCAAAFMRIGQTMGKVKAGDAK